MLKIVITINYLPLNNNHQKEAKIIKGSSVGIYVTTASEFIFQKIRFFSNNQIQLLKNGCGSNANMLLFTLLM